MNIKRQARPEWQGGCPAEWLTDPRAQARLYPATGNVEGMAVRRPRICRWLVQHSPREGQGLHRDVDLLGSN
jgi:hypothetical protein